VYKEAENRQKTVGTVGKSSRRETSSTGKEAGTEEKRKAAGRTARKGRTGRKQRILRGITGAEGNQKGYSNDSKKPNRTERMHTGRQNRNRNESDRKGRKRK
jgi:hypothetical protein